MMALSLTPSQRNAQDIRSFVPILHTNVYPAIDPSAKRLPQPFTVVVLGGSGAVGGALARSYALAGATGLVLAARRLPVVEDVAKEAKLINPSIKALAMQCDVGSASDVASVANATKAQFGNTVGAVVVNAGYSGAMNNDITLEGVEEMETAFRVNTLGTAYAGKYFIPLLNESINTTRVFIGISSMAAPTISGPIAHVHYSASKFAQVRVIEMINEQQAKNGLFVASVHPGGINSDFAIGMPDQLKHCKYFSAVGLNYC
jgi:NAD(P)-dependent dehydrogenase (short-subunit alcohol dehydrogenase family)